MLSRSVVVRQVRTFKTICQNWSFVSAANCKDLNSISAFKKDEKHIFFNLLCLHPEFEKRVPEIKIIDHGGRRREELVAFVLNNN